MEVVNLADAPGFIGRYVALRNLYNKELFTDIVTVDGTANWLKYANVYVIVAIDESELIGAAILYLDKNGEVAIFTKRHQCGVASRLLDGIKHDSRQTFFLKNIWAWIADDNIKSSNLFIKNGFIKKASSHKAYDGQLINGSVYEYNVLNCYLGVDNENRA